MCQTLHAEEQVVSTVFKELTNLVQVHVNSVTINVHLAVVPSALPASKAITYLKTVQESVSVYLVQADH